MEFLAQNHIRLWSGEVLNLERIAESNFELSDIIVGMVRALRWSNQTKIAVSVAHHTLQCYEFYSTFEMLLYHAPAAYIGDIFTSEKRSSQLYNMWHREIYTALCRKWNLHTEYDKRCVQVSGRVTRAEWDNCVVLGKGALYQESDTTTSVQLNILFQRHIQKLRSTRHVN